MYGNYLVMAGILLIILTAAIHCNNSYGFMKDQKANTVLTVLLIRNKEHTLPYFLTIFENLSYPKDRISLFIRSDHNHDATIPILKKWLDMHERNYHSVDVILDESGPKSYPNEGSPSNWTTSRFDHIIHVKDEALSKGKNMWADYIWYLDVDTFIVCNDIIQILIDAQKPIVAPMLNSLGTYSNYWCGMTEHYWYTRTDEYFPILDRKKRGCFSVPMVHSCILIDLTIKASDKLSFNPKNLDNFNGPKDDIIVFAVGSKTVGMEMYICNEIKYGFIPPPLSAEDSHWKDLQQLRDLQLEVLVDHPPLEISEIFSDYKVANPAPSLLDFSHIYMISLKRRPDRRQRMLQTFVLLGIDSEVFDAVDGKMLTLSYLEQLGVKQLRDYKDPWFKRNMTYGEIGCFLSHYFIWKDIVEKGYKEVIVFEDDIRFEPNFIENIRYMMDNIHHLQLKWDFIYIGRKKLKKYNEPWVEGSDILVHVEYSYWTLGYIITLEGAKKLLRPKPLQKLVPVDEYIPIMFDRHPEVEWKSAFWPRDLVAYSVAPLMINPTHYVGEEGYYSDTENSTIIDELRELRLEARNAGMRLTRGDADLKLNALKKDEL